MSDELDLASPDPASRDIDQLSDVEARARVLLELAGSVTGTLDLQEVLDRSFAALRQLMDFGGGAIQLIEGDHLVAAATDPPMAPEAATVRIPVGEGVSGGIAASGQPVYIQDIAVDERVHPEGRKHGVSAGVRSYFGIPLIMGGRPTGVVQVDAPGVDAFDARTRARVLAFVPTIAAAVQNARLFEQERDAIRRIEEADLLKANFLSIVSHELRTPMSVVNGFAETLASRVSDLTDDQVADLGQRIWGAGRRLQTMLEDLLYASRLEDGAIRYRPMSVDVGELVREVVRDVSIDREVGGPFQSMRITEVFEPRALVAVDLEGDGIRATADPEQLRKVVRHLVENALKFSPADEPVWVRVRHDEGGGVVVIVEDRGTGIPPATRDAIFSLFFQLEDAHTRSVGGLGIGLYIVRRLTEEMGATIGVEDGAEGGTVFRVALPS